MSQPKKKKRQLKKKRIRKRSRLRGGLLAASQTENPSQMYLNEVRVAGVQAGSVEVGARLVLGHWIQY
jgi:hypothetical protein